jgi:LysR family positive regulator for ilvC
VPDVVIQHSPMRDKIKQIVAAPELKAFQIGLCVLERQLKLPTLRAFWDNASSELM